MSTARTFITGSAGAGGGAMTLLGTATVSGAAATTLTLSGLDLSLYKHFWLVMALDNATGSSALISMYYNADTTATNYHRESLSCSATTVTAGRANDAVLATLAANETQTMIMFIANDRDGKPRNICYANRDAPSVVIGSNTWHCWVTAATITSITMSSSVASALAIGSTFSVWGVV